MLLRSFVRVGLAVSWLVACGGNVVIETEGSSAPSCEVPAPVGGLACHGAIAVGNMTIVCSNTCFDGSQHEYTSVCDEDGCQCWYAGALVCGCEQPAVDDCQSRTSCCPEPWQ